MQPNELRTKAPDLFEFENYRIYLAAYFQFKKRQNPAFSYGSWARALGLKNNTSLLKILNGSRDAGPEITRRLVEYFKFNDRSRIYFEDLIRLAKVKSDGAAQVQIMEQLKRHHPLRRFHLLDESEFSIIADWWHYAIRQMTKIIDFKADADWISRKLLFKVTPKQVTKAITTLVEGGLLKKSANLLSIEKGNLETTTDLASEAVKRHHEGILENAHRSIRAVSVEERCLAGLTFAFERQNLREAKQMIGKFKEEFDSRFANCARPDSVYQLEVALFPLTAKTQEIEK